MGIPAPNYTQVPNHIFDVMADMQGSELKVVMAVCRKTFGWHKKRDKLSLSQLIELTGLARHSVLTGIELAIERGILAKTADPSDNLGGFFFELVIIEEQAQSDPSTSAKIAPVQKLHQCNNQTDTSAKIALPTSAKIALTKERVQRKEKKHGDGARAAPNRVIEQAQSQAGSAPPRLEKTEPSTPVPAAHVAYLANKGVGAAHLFADCDPSATIADFDARRADGWSISAIIHHWKQYPPNPKLIYQKEATHEANLPPRPGERGYTAYAEQQARERRPLRPGERGYT